jgi:hypothetical protein
VKLHARQRWLIIGGLLTATLAAAAWVRDGADPSGKEVVAAAAAERRSPPEALNDAPVIKLEKLQTRELGPATRDPFGAPIRRPPKSKPGTAARSAPAAVPQPPSAPPLPFTYMGKLMSGGDLAVFLVQGERNLVVHEGDTIDSLYRVERISDAGVTLLFLPLNQRQTIPIGEPQ